MWRLNLRKLRLYEAKLGEIFRSDDFSQKSIKSLIGMLSILMNFLLSCVHLRHIAEDVTDLTLRPVMIPIHLLMQTDEELTISHQASLSCFLSRGMCALLMSGARLRLTNVSTERVLRKYCLIKRRFALGICI